MTAMCSPRQYENTHAINRTATTVPRRGSTTRICLSLHVVANKLPSRFHDTEKMVSGWTSMTFSGSPVAVFHTMHCIHPKQRQYN